MSTISRVPAAKAQSSVRKAISTVRYSVASMGYQLAGIIGGALAPIISVALLDRFDTTIAVPVYAVFMLLVAIVCVLLAPETSKIDLHADPANQPTRSR